MLNSYESITERSISIRKDHTGVIRLRECIRVFKAVHDVPQAQECLKEFEAVFQGAEVRVNTRGCIMLSDGGEIKVDHYLQWVSSVIPCFMICNQLESAEKYINMAIDIANDFSSRDAYFLGQLFFLKFHWCSKKLKQLAISREIASKLPESLRKKKDDGSSDGDLAKEMEQSLEAAIRYRNNNAIMAGIVHHLDEENSAFSARFERGLELLDVEIDRAKSNRSYDGCSLNLITDS